MAKEFGGQPWWVWAAGGVALVGGYLWIRRSQNTAAAATASQAPAPVFVGQGTGIDSAALATWMSQQQGQPSATPTCPKGYAYDADSKKCIPEKHKEGGGGKGKG